MSNPNTSKYEEGKEKKWTGRVLEGTKSGSSMQTRFERIPEQHLNRETVAGIRDMTLGRVKNGKPVGAATIRFDTGRNSGSNPHINIDPRGRPSARNPHIEVSEGVIKSAQAINSTLKYVGIGLTVTAVVIDAWRFGSAFKDDLYIRDHADEIIKELEDAIQKLEMALKTESRSKERQNIRETIEHLKKVLKDVKRTKKVPVKTLKTASSITGGWGAGAAGGTVGAWAGAKAGAAIGTLFGPVGTVVGAPIGAVLFAVGGGIVAGSAGSYAGEAVAEKGLELLD